MPPDQPLQSVVVQPGGGEEQAGQLGLNDERGDDQVAYFAYFAYFAYLANFANCGYFAYFAHFAYLITMITGQVAREVARGCSRGFSSGREATGGTLTLSYWDVALS